MSFESPNFEQTGPNGMRYAVVAARFNETFVEPLLASALDALRENGVSDDNIEIVRVPGAGETPYAARMLSATEDFDCIIALGVIVKGETAHYDILSNSVAAAIQQVNITGMTPVINGVLSCENEEQARARCMGEINRGGEFGLAAIAMADASGALAGRLLEGDGLFSLADDEDEEPEWLYPNDEDDEPWKS